MGGVWVEAAGDVQSGRTRRRPLRPEPVIWKKCRKYPTLYAMEHDAFSRLGWSPNRTAVYLALLEAGEAPASSLAVRAGLKRTTVYEILEGLVADGLAAEGRIGKRRTFTAEPPEALRGLVARQEKAVAQLVPMLLQRTRGPAGAPRFRYYAGLGGVRRVNEMLLEAGVREYRYFGSVQEMVDLLGESWLRHYVRRRVALGIRSRGIRVRGGEVKDLPWMKAGGRLLREVRFVPKSVTGDLASVYLLPDRVLVSAGSRECYALVLESRELSRMLGSMWDTLWDLLPGR